MSGARVEVDIEKHIPQGEGFGMLCECEYVKKRGEL